MRRKPILAFALCAALLLTLCAFVVPKAMASSVDYGDLYVGGLKVTPGINSYNYYRYSESGATPTLTETTSNDYNLALQWTNGRYSLKMNGLTVTRTYTYPDDEFSRTRHSCIFVNKPIDIELLGANTLTAPDGSDYDYTHMLAGLHIQVDYYEACSISGTGSLTSQCAENVNRNLRFSRGIDVQRGTLKILSGEITAKGGVAGRNAYSGGVVALSVEMTGGKLTASGGLAGTSTGVSVQLKFLLTGGEVILTAHGYDASYTINATPSNNSVDLGSQKWYIWKYNVGSETEPSGAYYDSETNPYVYDHNQMDKYLRIRPRLAVDRSELDFGSLPEGYTPSPAEQTFTITNMNDATVALNKTASASDFYLSPGGDSFTLSRNEKKTFTVQPLPRLPAGVHNQELAFTVDAYTVRIPVRFTVTPVAPAIVTQPADQFVKEGQRAEFTVAATGTSPRYQWQVNKNDGAGWINIENASSTNYNTEITTSAMNGWQYRCVVSNAEGSVESDPATLAVTVDNPPVITVDPADQKVATTGGSATFTVTATGDGTLHYSWEVSTDHGATWATPTGATDSASYTVTDVQPASNGHLYRCKVSSAVNPSGVYSQPATLTVAPVAPGITAGFSAIVLAVSYSENNSASFTVTGNPAPAVTLQNPSGTPDSSRFITWDSANKRLHYMPGLAAGAYTIVLTASNGVSPAATCSVTLTVVDLDISIAPASGTLYTNTPITLSAVAPTLTSPTYRWFQNTSDVISGATPVGTDSPTYAYTPVAPGTLYYFYNLTGTLNGISVNMNSRFLRVDVSALPPLLTGPAKLALASAYGQTTFGGFTLTGSPTVTLDSQYSQIIWDNANRQLVVAPGLAAGSYTVTLRASDGVRPDETHDVTLTVVDVAVQSSTPASSTVYTDTDVTLTAVIPPAMTGVSYQWYRSDTPSTTGGAPIAGADNSPYTFRPDAGTAYYFYKISGMLNGEAVTLDSAITPISAVARLSFTDSPAFDIPGGSAGVAITPVAVSGGVAGGTPPYAFSLESHPAWLFIDAQTGVITGTRPSTPTAATTATVKVTDLSNPVETKSIEIAVGAVLISANITVMPASSFMEKLAPEHLTLHIGAAGQLPNEASHFGSLEIMPDGGAYAIVPSGQYRLTFGSLHIELSQPYLNALPAGGYTLRVNLAGACAGLSPTVRLVVAPQKPQPTPPATGDSGIPGLWLALALVAACGLAVCAYRFQGRKPRGNA